MALSPPSFLSLRWVIVRPAFHSSLFAFIHATSSGLTITPRRSDLSADGIALVAVQGPNARAKVWQVAPQTQSASEGLKPFNAVIVHDTPFGELMVARTGYTGEDGFEIGVPASQVEALWNALAAAGVKPAGLGARDTLRLEAGMNLYGQDMDDNVSPLDAGLAWTVDLASERAGAPDGFIGKAALQQAGQTQQFVGLILREKGGILRAHQKVVAASGNAGEITSGTFSPSMQQAIALARVPLDVAVGDTVHVEIRDKKLAASVVKLPFVRNGKILAS
jgi:aminomethyltransferase